LVRLTAVQLVVVVAVVGVAVVTVAAVTEVVGDAHAFGLQKHELNETGQAKQFVSCSSCSVQFPKADGKGGTRPESRFRVALRKIRPVRLRRFGGSAVKEHV
jgi:hypothetical protein